MLKDPTLASLIKERSVSDKVLSPTEEAFHSWFLTNSNFVQGRKEQLCMSDMDGFAANQNNAQGISPEEIARDKNFLKKLRNQDGQKDKIERAEIFEAIVEHFAENADWFGGYVIKTLEYDDRINSVDFVIEWEGEKEGETTRLGIDVTVSAEDRMQAEIEKILDNIDEGHLSSVKYFRSEADKDRVTGDNRKFRLSNIPRVIIHLRKEKLNALCGIALKIINKQPGAKREIEKADVVLQFLSEAKNQLDRQFEYLEETKSKKYIKLYGLLKKRILSARDRIDKVLEEKIS